MFNFILICVFFDDEGNDEEEENDDFNLGKASFPSFTFKNM